MFEAGGYAMTGPTGKRFDISLDPWVGRGDDVLLRIYVHFIDPAKAGTFDPLHPARRP